MIEQILEWESKLQSVDKEDQYYTELCNRLRPRILEKHPNAIYGLLNQCSDWIGTGQDAIVNLNDEIGLAGSYRKGQRGWQYFELSLM